MTRLQGSGFKPTTSVTESALRLPSLQPASIVFAKCDLKVGIETGRARISGKCFESVQKAGHTERRRLDWDQTSTVCEFDLRHQT
jgi:hypothetical protein